MGKTTAQNYLAIRDVLLRSGKVQISEDIRPDNAENSVKGTLGFQGVSGYRKYSASTSDDKPVWVYNFRYSVGVKCSAAENQSEASDDEDGLLEITAEFDAEYFSKKELDEADLDEFSESNVGYHVWPYWREYVQSTACRMGLPSKLVSVPFYFAANRIAD